MTFSDIKKAINAIIKDYHPDPDKWIFENQQEILKRAKADGSRKFLGALELFCKSRQGKIRFFFEDYQAYKNAFDTGREGTLRSKAHQMSQDVRKDIGKCAEIRAEGLKYFESEEWQALKQKVGVAKHNETNEVLKGG